MSGRAPVGKLYSVKCFTVPQPWATLIMLGAKEFITTFKKPEWPRFSDKLYIGPLAIHASSKREYLSDQFEGAYQAIEPFKSLLNRAGIYMTSQLPLGKILGVVDLVRWHNAEMVKLQISERERDLGDYADNRKAWYLQNPRPFSEPVPWRGEPGIWEWKTRFIPTFITPNAEEPAANVQS